VHSYRLYPYTTRAAAGLISSYRQWCLGTAF